MKKFINLKSILAVTAIVVSALVFTACQKENLATGKPLVSGKKVTLSEIQKRNVESLAQSIPTVRLWDQANNRFMDIDIFNRTVTREWTFANPTEGYEYAGTSTWSNADGSQMVVLTISGTSSGSGGGGTVVAGNSVLDIDYAFCFNIDVEAVGIDLFSSLGGDFDGASVAGVVGIAGDFEALANNELGEDPDFEDFFQGFAQYVVYDDYADGNYDVLNWFDDLDGESDDLDGNAFSFVIDFQNFGIYFSSGGSIDVNGSSMNFNGEYLALGDFLLDLGEEEGDLDITEVYGYGEMGCN